MSGLRFLTRDSAGGLVLASYHPKGCLTWHWSVTFTRTEHHRGVASRAKRRTGQWHDFYRVPFGTIIVSRQDYHRGRAA